MPRISEISEKSAFFVVILFFFCFCFFFRQYDTLHAALPHNVTAAILVFQNNETAAILVYQTDYFVSVHQYGC